MNTFLTRGNIYTLKELLDFPLSDAPYLEVDHEDVTHPIQTSHITEEEFLSIEGWAESTWKYRYTTSEWIPIFSATPEFNKDLIHIESRTSKYRTESEIIVEPKGAAERFL